MNKEYLLLLWMVFALQAVKMGVKGRGDDESKYLLVKIKDGNENKSKNAWMAGNKKVLIELSPCTKNMLSEPAQKITSTKIVHNCVRP